MNTLHSIRVLGALSLQLAACQLVAGIDEIHSPDSAPSGLCSEYCKEVTSKCTDEHAVYSSEAQCQAVCRLMRPGTEKDAREDTVGCRLNRVRMIASSERGSSCSDVGPGGDGVCGDNCESYCDLMSKACGADDYLKYWTGDRERCIAGCSALRDISKQDNPPEVTYSALNESARDHNGDTLQCRLFHVVAASEGAQLAAMHCWHASIYPSLHLEGETMPNPCLAEKHPDKTPLPSPNCQDYCRLISAACRNDGRIYEDEAQCLASCSADGFKVGALEDGRKPNGNKVDTLGCRYSHAYDALVSESDDARGAECNNASPTGGGDDVCGPRCAVFCDQLRRSCGEIPGYSCDQSCKDELTDRNVTYSLKMASSGTSPFACRLKAMVEARAAKSIDAMDVVRARCQAAIGAPGSDCE